jgi:hypothetical protein
MLAKVRYLVVHCHAVQRSFMTFGMVPIAVDRACWLLRGCIVDAEVRDANWWQIKKYRSRSGLVQLAASAMN